MSLINRLSRGYGLDFLPSPGRATDSPQKWSSTIGSRDYSNDASVTLNLLPKNGRNGAQEILSAVPVEQLLVEVPGIEPGSFVALMGLLRAQCASPLLGPTDHAHKSV